MTDHEHTPPTEAELEMWGHDFGYTSAMNVLVREVRRLRAERSADSERLTWYIEQHPYTYVTLADGSSKQFQVIDRDDLDKAKAADHRFIAAARQEPTP